MPPHGGRKTVLNGLLCRNFVGIEKKRLSTGSLPHSAGRVLEFCHDFLGSLLDGTSESIIFDFISVICWEQQHNFFKCISGKDLFQCSGYKWELTGCIIAVIK